MSLFTLFGGEKSAPKPASKPTSPVVESKKAFKYIRNNKIPLVIAGYFANKISVFDQLEFPCETSVLVIRGEHLSSKTSELSKYCTILTTNEDDSITWKSNYKDLFIDIETAYDCIDLLLLGDHLEDYKLDISIESMVELAGVLVKQVIFDLNDTPYNEKKPIIVTFVPFSIFLSQILLILHKMTSSRCKQSIFSFVLKYMNKASTALVSGPNDNDMKGNFYSAIEESKYDECYDIMRGIVPVKIAIMSLKEVIACGLPQSIADRIWNNKLLWLICMHEDDIPKIHIADLRGKYSSHGLDIVEMRALWKVLRDKWPSGDPRGEWLNTFKSKLEFLILKERQDTLGPNESRHFVYSNNQVDEADLEEEDNNRFYPREIAYFDPDTPLIKRFGGDHTVVSSNHVYNSNDVVTSNVVESDVLDEEFGFVIETDLDDAPGKADAIVESDVAPTPSPTWKEYFDSRKSGTADEEQKEVQEDQESSEGQESSEEQESSEDQESSEEQESSEDRESGGVVSKELSIDEDDKDIDDEIDNFVIPDELLGDKENNVEEEDDRSELDDVAAAETLVTEQVVRIESEYDEATDLQDSEDSQAVVANEEAAVSNEEETTTAEYQHLDDIVLTLDEMKEIFNKYESIEEFILLGDPRIAKELLIEGEIVLSDEDATALLIHCSELNEVIVAPLETLMFLIDNCKASVNATDFETGNTSLHYVFTNAVLGKFLVSRGADVLIKDNNGESPLSLCLEYGYTWLLSSYKANFEQNSTLFSEEHASRLLIYLLEHGYGQYVADYVSSGIGKVSTDDALRIMEMHQGCFDKLPQSVETYEILEQLILQEDE